MGKGQSTNQSQEEGDKITVDDISESTAVAIGRGAVASVKNFLEIPRFLAISILVGVVVIVFSVIFSIYNTFDRASSETSSVPFETMIAIEKQQLAANKIEVALSQQQLSIQTTIVAFQERIATAVAKDDIPPPTITAAAAELMILQATRSALESEKKQIYATRTAIAAELNATPLGATEVAELVLPTLTPTERIRTVENTPIPTPSITPIVFQTNTPTPTHATTPSELGNVSQGSITFSKPMSGTIEPAVEQDVYTFDASEGDTIAFSVSVTSGELDPEFKIFRPDASLLCGGRAYDVARTTCVIDVDGAYTILVQDWDGVKTGSYDLFVQQMG